MGLFSKHGGLAKLGKKIGDSAKHTAEIIYHPTEAIGRLINDVTGVTTSAKQQAEANKQLQEMAQNYNAEQAQIERDWQENMSNTAQQRAVEDAKKAGVNPVLMAGAGASSGSGAVATSPGGSTGAGVGSNPIQSIAELIKAVNNTAKTNAEVDNINQDTKNKKQENENGGTGGTGVTRTLDWVGNKISKTSARANKNIEKMKKNSVWSKEFWN